MIKKANWLFAAVILIALSSCSMSKNVARITVKNPTTLERSNEIVEVDWNKVSKKLTLQPGLDYIVTNSRGQQVIHQLITNGEESPVSLIFPVDLNPRESQTFYVVLAEKPKKHDPLVYGRLVPERKDDFAWENNRVAYRIYGPALQATGEISGGLDIWVKSTEQLVIDKWYKDDLAGIKSYHQDHGEGLDFYKVGPTLGLGMTSPITDNKLWLGKNFISSEILDMGPLRITMKFKYAPIEVEGQKVTETRIISLDAFNYLNKVVSIFESDASELELATGLVTSGDGSAPTWSDSANGIIVYEVPKDAKNGTIFTGAINPKGFADVRSNSNHFMGINSYKPGQEYLYYTGGGWSKSEFTDGLNQWIDYLKIQKEKIDNPLVVKVK